MREGRDLTRLSDKELDVLYREAAQKALDVQDACNMSGVVYSWAEVMDVICELDNRGKKGTEWKNRHPINSLFAAKLADLSMVGPVGGVNNFDRATRECRELTGK